LYNYYILNFCSKSFANVEKDFTHYYFYLSAKLHILVQFLAHKVRD